MLQKTLFIFGIFSVAALTLASASAERDIFQLVSSDPALSTFVTAINAAGWVRDQGPLTVFAPTNEAFAKLDPAFLAHLLDPANVNELGDVIKFHCLPVTLQSKDLKARKDVKGDGELTYQGSELFFETIKDSPSTLGIDYVGLRGGFVNAVFVDLQASDGVVHVIDQVLIPSGPTNNIADYVTLNDDLSTLALALKAGELIDTLSGYGPFTVFAPTNEAFAKLPAATLAHLLDPANLKELDAVLTYHVAAGSVYAKDITDGEKIKTVEGQDVTASIYMGNRVFINNALVTTADVATSNGVVHIIDTVLSLPKPLRTIFDSIAHVEQSYAQFQLLIQASGLDRTLNDPKDGPFTVFVPTDEAFAKLPRGTVDRLCEPENIDELLELLNYHIIANGKSLRAGCTKVGRTCGPNDLEGDAIKFGYQPATAFWKTLNGQSLIVLEGYDTDNVTTFIGDGTGNAATILTFKAASDDDSSGENALASNGIWHVVDKVFMGPSKDRPDNRTIFETIAHANAGPSGYDTFLAAVKAAKLDRVLNNPKDGPFTVFVPTEEAFAKLPRGTLDHLLKPENIDELIDLLDYHIIANGKFLRSGCTKQGFTCGPDDLEGDAMKLGYQPAVAFWKTVQGQSLTVLESEDNSTTFIDDSTGNAAAIQTFEDADASGENAYASNGIWHVINKVLMPCHRPGCMPANATKMLK